jgi:hypothetical protein
MVVLVLSFLGLGWWQIGRASGGNTLSWGYAVEWPLFAGFVIFVWIREIRLTLRGEPAPTPAPAQAPSGVRRPIRVPRRSVAYDDGGDTDLAEYNHYLQWLNDNPGARAADYPG